MQWSQPSSTRLLRIEEESIYGRRKTVETNFSQHLRLREDSMPFEPSYWC